MATKLFVLRDPTGATIVTPSLAGHEDCDLVGEASRAPEDDEDFDPATKRWKKRPDAAARAKRRARQTAALDRGDLVDRIEALEAKVAALEARGNPR